MAVYTRLEWHGELANAAFDEGAANGLTLAAEHLLQVSREVVPLEEGTLSRSGVADVDRGDLRAAVSYDGPYRRGLSARAA